MTSDPADLERARAAPTEPGEPGDPEPAEAPPGTGRSWVKVSAVAMAVAVVFVAVRLLVPAHGDISRFVVAGSTFADKSHTPSQLHVFPTSDGYDGQFVWRMAADPAYLHTSPHLGMALDSPLRLQRIGYPALAWVLSWGNLALLPWALVVVNLVAIGAVSGVGAVIAHERGPIAVVRAAPRRGARLRHDPVARPHRAVRGRAARRRAPGGAGAVDGGSSPACGRSRC